jgi:hypothetical protein
VTLYRWPAQGRPACFCSFLPVRGRGRLVFQVGHDGSVLSASVGHRCRSRDRGAGAAGARSWRATSRLTLRVRRAARMASKARDADGDARHGARRHLRNEVFSAARISGRRELHHHRRVHRFHLGALLDTRLAALRTTEHGLLTMRFLPSVQVVPFWPGDVRPWRPQGLRSAEVSLRPFRAPGRDVPRAWPARLRHGHSLGR